MRGRLYSVEWTSGMEYWNSGMPYFILDLSKAYAYPDAAQAASDSSQSNKRPDRLSSGATQMIVCGMREVVGKAARVEHIVGKTLCVTSSLSL